MTVENLVIPRPVDVVALAENVTGVIPDIRPIPNYPGYFISNLGTVFSGNGSSLCVYCGKEVKGDAGKRYCSEKCRQISWYHRKRGRPDPFDSTLKAMQPREGEQGYLRVELHRNHESKREHIHRLVLTVFDREPVAGEQACHRDGNPGNNALSNLRWGDQSANWEDRLLHRHGRTCQKLTSEQVLEIRRRYAAGERQTGLAVEFQIDSSTMSRIIRRKSWRSI